MKKIFCAFLSIILILSMLCGCSTKHEYQPIESKMGDGIKIVSFNCAAPWGNLLNGTASSARAKRFADYMNTVRPDSIGTQEMNQKWLDKLGELMSEYDSYGVIRGGDDNENKSEMNAVLWLRDKYDALDKGTFWLSETPDAESRYDGAGCNRVCSWVLLALKGTNTPYYIHMNTHLDNASEKAANYGAEVIVQKMNELTAQYADIPIVLTGDFNETAGMPAYNTIAERLNEFGGTAADNSETQKPTYHEWGKIEEGEPIDFIFVSKDKYIADYKVLDDVSNGFVSDHYGVYAEWSLSQPE